MENWIFEIVDKSRRKIHLSKERWSHIRKKHPEIEELELIEQTIRSPDKITENYNDETVCRYYKYYKSRKPPKNYLLVIIKYLNGDGYVVTALFDKHI